MRVAGLTATGDWRFGKGRAVYRTRSDAIRQNVLTRLRSFRDDWFLDIEAGSPWLTLFSSRGAQKAVLLEVERVVLQTEGVLRIDRLRLVRVDSDRRATIELAFTDIFDQQFSDQVVVP